MPSELLGKMFRGNSPNYGAQSHASWSETSVLYRSESPRGFSLARIASNVIPRSTLKLEKFRRTDTPDVASTTTTTTTTTNANTKRC